MDQLQINASHAVRLKGDAPLLGYLEQQSWVIHM